MSTPSNVTVPPDYDPFVQTFTLIDRDGVPFNVTMADVDWLRNYGCRLAINYGSQIGASAMLLLILLLLTRREKRRSAIFIMNALCLAINTIRSILQSLWLTGNWFNVYAQLTYDPAKETTQDLANTILSNTMTLLLVICIMASLTMQVWVVCKTTHKLQRIAIMTVTTALALIAIGYRFAVVVISNIKTIERGDMFAYAALLDQMSIFQAVAIWAYCAIFTLKLGYAIIQRRKLGMTQFGPMQIVFIMGAQTMVIPAIFSVLQWYKSVPELGSQTLTIVCIFLPLSAIWAGVIANDVQIASRGPDAHQRLLTTHFGRSQTGLPGTERSGASNTLKSNGASSLSAKEGLDSPTMVREREDEGEGIYVESGWVVEKGEGSGGSRRGGGSYGGV